ncbi:MAG: hypothetical protein ACLVL2_25745, partial [Bacteroides cellulosilyticus]
MRDGSFSIMSTEYGNASDLLGAWESSQIYVKWDKKKIDKAYSLSATEVTKDAEGDGYTIKMSLVGTPVVGAEALKPLSLNASNT